MHQAKTSEWIVSNIISLYNDTVSYKAAMGTFDLVYLLDTLPEKSVIIFHSVLIYFF